MKYVITIAVIASTAFLTYGLIKDIVNLIKKRKAQKNDIHDSNESDINNL